MNQYMLYGANLNKIQLNSYLNHFKSLHGFGSPLRTSQFYIPGKSRLPEVNAALNVPDPVDFADQTAPTAFTNVHENKNAPEVPSPIQTWDPALKLDQKEQFHPVPETKAELSSLQAAKKRKFAAEGVKAIKGYGDNLNEASLPPTSSEDGRAVKRRRTTTYTPKGPVHRFRINYD